MDSQTESTITEAKAMTPAQLIAAGLTHHHDGRLEAARELYLQVLALEPESFDALHLMGVLALQEGKHQVAAELIEKAVQHNAHPVAFNNLGEAYKGLGRADAAEPCYRKALELSPEFAEVWNNLANALKELGRPSEAAQAFRQALVHKPDFVPVHTQLGDLLEEMGETDEAAASYAAALALAPQLSDATRKLARVNLMRGDYVGGAGYLDFAYAEGETPVARRKESLTQLKGKARWQGEPLQGQRLLLVCEQGAGDNLMMMRYLPLVQKLGPSKLILYGTPHLVRLLRLREGIEVVSMTEKLPLDDFDLYAPMMSLPALFGTTLETIPAQVPYLRLPVDLRESWRLRLHALSRVKVGLCWAAGKLSPTSARRSIELKQLLPLSEIPGMQAVSLQKGIEAEQLSTVDWQIFDCMSECRDFLDTAALMEGLDLVITVDTAVAHLAGALGKPVWLLNSFESEWRWMLNREDSPWYPTMRIFRQKERGEWEGVVNEVATWLKDFTEVA